LKAPKVRLLFAQRENSHSESHWIAYGILLSHFSVYVQAPYFVQKDGGTVAKICVTCAVFKNSVSKFNYIESKQINYFII
jgi:hypothetical protein